MKGLFRSAGIIVSLASLIFVALSIRRSFNELTEDILSVRFLVLMVALAFPYAVLLQLIGIAWHQMIVVVDGPTITLQRALAIFNRSQVYKYLPGNVFHMVGRYTLAKNAGASHSALAFSQIGEIGIILSAALVLALAFSTDILVDGLSRSGLNEPVNIAILVALVGAIVVTTLVAFRSKLRRFGRATAVVTLRVFLIYVLFFLGNGLLAYILVASLHDSGWEILGPVIGVASGAWLLGFVIPGAPGGLGAREAVMIAGLAAIGIPLSSATAVAIGFRITTIIGDSFVAIVEFAIRTRIDAAQI